MKQTGIVDRFEGDFVVVEINDKMVNFPRAETPLDPLPSSKENAA